MSEVPLYQVLATGALGDGAEMCSGSKVGSYLRLIDFCITQL